MQIGLSAFSICVAAERQRTPVPATSTPVLHIVAVTAAVHKDTMAARQSTWIAQPNGRAAVGNKPLARRQTQLDTYVGRHVTTLPPNMRRNEVAHRYIARAHADGSSQARSRALQFVRGFSNSRHEHEHEG